MKDLPGILLVATVWAYWFGVGIMIVRARRDSRRLAGLLPEQRTERYLWLVWVPLVAAWNIVPYLVLTHTTGPWASPVFAKNGYATVRWLAVPCAFASLLATSLCWARMGRHWRMDVSAQRGELITDGPFRYVRHPIYALQRALMLSSLAIVPTWPMLALTVVLFALTQAKAIYEEQHLVKVHGVAYGDYVAHTRRFLPTLRDRRLRSPASIRRSAPGGKS